jgi:hypothetical protein
MNDATDTPGAPRGAQNEPADRQDREAGTPAGEHAARAEPHAPGSNKLSDVKEQDVDKLVPRDRDETKLHDHSLGDADERDQPDDAGNLPGTL